MTCCFEFEGGAAGGFQGESSKGRFSGCVRVESVGKFDFFGREGGGSLDERMGKIISISFNFTSNCKA